MEPNNPGQSDHSLDSWWERDPRARQALEAALEPSREGTLTTEDALAHLQARAHVTTDDRLGRESAVAPRSRSRWRLLRAPVPPRFSQLVLGMAMATIIAVKMIPSRSASSLGATIQTAPQALLDTLHLVRFLLTAPPGTRTVAVAGNFAEHGESRALLQYDRVHDQWTGMLVLAPGVYHYRYVVNDTGWLLDPHASIALDKNGHRVSSITVTATDNSVTSAARTPHDT